MNASRLGRIVAIVVVVTSTMACVSSTSDVDDIVLVRRDIQNQDGDVGAAVDDLFTGDVVPIYDDDDEGGVVDKPSSVTSPQDGTATPDSIATAPLLSDDGLDDLLGDVMPLGDGVATTSNVESDHGAKIDSTSSTSAAPFLEDWKGFVATKIYTYFDDRGQGRDDEQIVFETEFEFRFRFGDDVTAFFRPRLLADLTDTHDLHRFEPLEGYVTIAGSGFDLRLGQFIENWGIVDTFNPIDVVNRRDFATDFLDPDRLGELGIRFRLLFDGGETIGEPTLSLYALPLFCAPRFAAGESRFSFDRPGLAFDEDDGFEPNGFEQGFYAARFTSTLDTSPFNADVQVVVARGPERTPTFGGLIGKITKTAVARPVYFGATTIGAGLRAVPNEDVAGSFLAGFTFKLEAVYKKHHDFDGSPMAAPEDYFAMVVGFDYPLDGVLDDQDQLTFTVEYAWETGADDFTSRFRPFRNDLILRAFWEANDFARTSIEVRLLVDLDHDERVAEAIFQRQLRFVDDDLQLELQLRWFDRAPTGETLFSLFPNNSSVAIGLRYDF